MGMKYAEEPFNMGMFFFLPKESFKMSTFSDPQHTHTGTFYTGVAPPPPVGCIHCVGTLNTYQCVREAGEMFPGERRGMRYVSLDDVVHQQYTGRDGRVAKRGQRQPSHHPGTWRKGEFVHPCHVHVWHRFSISVY